MTDAPPADSLAPDPAQAVQLAVAVTRGDWPATDDAATADRAEREASARQEAAHAQAATRRP